MSRHQGDAGIRAVDRERGVRGPRWDAQLQCEVRRARHGEAQADIAGIRPGSVLHDTQLAAGEFEPRFAGAVEVDRDTAVDSLPVGKGRQLLQRHRAAGLAAAPVGGVHAAAVREHVVAPVLAVGRLRAEQVVVRGAFDLLRVARLAGDRQQLPVQLDPRQRRAGFHVTVRAEHASRVEHLARAMAHAAPRPAAQGEVVLADAAPGVLHRAAVIRVAGGAMQLGQADQVPRQLIGLAGGDGGNVRVLQRTR